MKPLPLLPRLLTALLGLACAAGASAQVGLSMTRFGDLPVTLSYPTEARSVPTPFGLFTLTVATDAEPRPGRHRLVVISHGTGGSAVADHALAQALVREGFVVAQPLHRGDNFQDMSQAGPVAFDRRPREVIEVIDALAADPRWSARLKLDRVGVHGMSAGGVTGLSLAGAQWRTLNLVRHCNQHAADDEAFCFNGAARGAARAARQASYERARGVPELFLPADLKALHGGRTPTDGQPDPRPDPRIAAVTLAVPLAAIFSPESLARIAVPLGVVSAERDEVLVPRFHSDHVLKHCGRCVRLADLPGAGHFDLLWPWPEAVAREVAAMQVRGGDPVPGFDGRLREAAQARIAAFHRQHLGGPD